MHKWTYFIVVWDTVRAIRHLLMSVQSYIKSISLSVVLASVSRGFSQGWHLDIGGGVRCFLSDRQREFAATTNCYFSFVILQSTSCSSLSLLEAVIFSGGSVARLCLLSLCSQQWAFIVTAV